MSFSGTVKEELQRKVDNARHCRIAELAAIIAFNGEILQDSQGKIGLRVSSENQGVIRKYFTLLGKTFKINDEVSIDERIVRKNNRFTIDVKNQETVVKVLQAVKILTADRQPAAMQGMVNQMVIQKNCCKRAFLRGAFYVKEGAQIVELLGLMGAGISLMNLENVRILKGMRNTVNRKVNCETANINKTVNAAVKQIEDIEYIQNTVGLQRLPENLEETARLRLEYPQASLKELGALLSVPLGKSGVNHRLRKISSIAEQLRGFKEEQV